MQNSGSEPIDVLDSRGLPTGEVATRDDVHAQGLWHRALHIWVVREERLVLLQRRAMSKELEPGKLDVSVGGHYRAGELFIDALREADEELGLTLRPGQPHYLGTARAERQYPDAQPARIDREFQEIYVVQDERPLIQYHLAKEEVDTLYEVPIDAAIALFQCGQHVAAAGFDAMKRPSNALLYDADLPSQGRSVHAQALTRVRAWLEGAAAEELARQPFDVE